MARILSCSRHLAIMAGHGLISLEATMALGEKKRKNRKLRIKDRTLSLTFRTLSAKTDLLRTVTIRGEPHSVIEAIERQMYHYSYHIGQIVYIAKQLNANNWKTLTIPRNRKTT